MSTINRIVARQQIIFWRKRVNFQYKLRKNGSKIRIVIVMFRFESVRCKIGHKLNVVINESKTCSSNNIPTTFLMKPKLETFSDVNLLFGSIRFDFILFGSIRPILFVSIRFGSISKKKKKKTNVKSGQRLHQNLQNKAEKEMNVSQVVANASEPTELCAHKLYWCIFSLTANRYENVRERSITMRRLWICSNSFVKSLQIFA